MRLWEAPEVVESDEELIECAKNHGFYISRKFDNYGIRLKPCICGYPRISTRVFRKEYLPDYGRARCFCVECGLRVQVSWDDDEPIDWEELEQKARMKWNTTVSNIIETQKRYVNTSYGGTYR